MTVSGGIHCWIQRRGFPKPAGTNANWTYVRVRAGRRDGSESARARASRAASRACPPAHGPVASTTGGSARRASEDRERSRLERRLRLRAGRYGGQVVAAPRFGRRIPGRGASTWPTGLAFGQMARAAVSETMATRKILQMPAGANARPRTTAI